jgi:hypothetical protein
MDLITDRRTYSGQALFVQRYTNKQRLGTKTLRHFQLWELHLPNCWSGRVFVHLVLQLKPAVGNAIIYQRLAASSKHGKRSNTKH